MRILVVGAGATGGFFGGRLAQAGRDVTFLVRPGRAEQLRQRGLRLIRPDGHIDVIQPTLVTAKELDHPYDLVLIAVKAGALPAAIRDAAPGVGERSAVIPFLNGLAHMTALNDAYGAERVLGGVVKVVTTITAEGDIHQMAPLCTVAIGEPAGGRSDRVEAVVSTMDGAGFEVSADDAIVPAMWHKWVFIAAAGALTCLMRGPVGDIVAAEGGVDLVHRILDEAGAVSAAAGFPVPAGETEFAVRILTQPGSGFTSSMYRDAAAGLPTEGGQILGDLTRRAADLGVPVPVLDLAALQLRVHDGRLTAGAGA